MYVGNLPFSATEDELRSHFSPYGAPTEVLIMTDRETGRARGFAFVGMDSSEAMDAAIRETNGRAFQGRTLTVNEARARENHSQGFGTSNPSGGRSDAGRVSGVERRGLR